MKMEQEIRKTLVPSGNQNAKELAEAGYPETLDPKLDEVLMKRYVPVDIYLDTDDPAALEAVNRAVLEVLETMDLEVWSEPEIFKGSILEKFWAATRSIASHIDVLKKIAGFITQFRKDSSDQRMDRLFSKKEPSVQLSETLKYLREVPNISVRVGTLLITKSTSRDIPVIQVKHLTRQESILLDTNPNILKNPKTLHRKLNTLKMEQLNPAARMSI